EHALLRRPGDQQRAPRPRPGDHPKRRSGAAPVEDRRRRALADGGRADLGVGVTLPTFLTGVLTTLSGVIALFFLRYWRSTRDRFFLLFACAFAALGLNWGIQAGTTPAQEGQHWAYVIRLVAFLLILVAIADKNRSDRR